jgi:hypothetical protein
VFRDLVEIQAGQAAQERIERELERADVLVFFDTPKAGESWWVDEELAVALGRHIPIVWIRLGPVDGRAPLRVMPSGGPAIVRDAIDAADARELADEILEKAFELARSHARISLKAVRRLERWARAVHAELEPLDQPRMIYELRHPAVARAYPARPATDVLQVYGRQPTDRDQRLLAEFLSGQGMGPHERDCRAFDAAILLAPTATGPRRLSDWAVVEDPARLLEVLDAQRAPAARERPKLLLLGAFPSATGAQQEVIDAVHAVVTSWLSLGGSLVFGGHPTFTPLVTHAARLVAPGREREAVTMFVSRWFASPADIEAYQAAVNVVPTDAQGDRDASLTLMRKQMIDGAGLASVVAAGGRTDEGGTHKPGLAEEVRLARMSGLPVYALGATGGQAAVIADQAQAQAWKSLGNRLSAEDNARLAESDDYEAAVGLIWRAATS